MQHAEILAEVGASKTKGTVAARRNVVSTILWIWLPRRSIECVDQELLASLVDGSDASFEPASTLMVGRTQGAPLRLDLHAIAAVC